jgi:hypothetical protein
MRNHLSSRSSLVARRQHRAESKDVRRTLYLAMPYRTSARGPRSRAASDQIIVKLQEVRSA